MRLCLAKERKGTYIVERRHDRKAKTDSEIREPVDHNGNADCSRARSLREQFSSDHPRNRAGPDSEKHHIDKCADNAHVGHPFVQKLEAKHTIREAKMPNIRDTYAKQ